MVLLMAKLLFSVSNLNYNNLIINYLKFYIGQLSHLSLLFLLAFCRTATPITLLKRKS